MSQLPTRRWSPSAVLKIITPNNDISCAGITQKGLPCNWDLGGDPKRRARNLLISMSQRPPHEALDDLPQLSRLCLCQKNHQQQAARVVAEWTVLIELYANSLKGEDNRQSHPSLDEIIAELNTLSIRQEQLRSLLPNDHPERTSLSPNTTHRVNQAQLSDSELSRDGQGQRRDSSSSRVFGRGRRPN